MGLRLLLFAVLCIVVCNIYLYAEAKLFPAVVKPVAVIFYAIPMVISVLVAFAMGLWRPGNPGYVYIVTALLCLATPWMALFALGATCLYLIQCPLSFRG